MYKEVSKFKNSGSFQFSSNDDLEVVCNAPNDASGVFLVYSIEEDNKTLIMVGSTGTVQNDGTLKAKNGGLYEKIVNGHQFAKTARKYSWKTQLQLEKIEAVEVFWYETYNNKTKVIPTFVEGQILQLFLKENGKLPRWNVAF
ncbi:hypothetical protein M0M57_15425 [Flavobacterium azooxidireducens]|uniref:Uncharacterized protein n=1 Tax=Flavobacterium azooxidireducens TaxID=1871076 RepID=A0ABY4KHT9_9FLAO|nr:hypothetical protein [Flavobacterium azooxidireducens]UPQ78997.1 hypothetical protein M0M57_15425 [Flavobacterium azooxidireducens]